MKAYVFPGQGAQFAGMGKDLYDSKPLAKELFDKANDILGYSNLKKRRSHSLQVSCIVLLLPSGWVTKLPLPWLQDTAWVSSPH